MFLKGNKYVYKPYDKRKDFIFPIIKDPNLNGNIPINHVYGVFISQLIRFCMINLLLEDFKNDVIELAVIMLQQGFKYMLKIIFNWLDNVVRWAHFGINCFNEDFINSIIPKHYS